MKSLYLFGVAFLIFLFVPVAQAQTKKIYCDKSNYKDFIYSNEKTKNLIKQTGKGCQLKNINLRGEILSKANLSNANLYQANLIGAHLLEANLSKTILSEAFLYNANLIKANLSNANLIGAKINRFSVIRSGLNIEDLKKRGTLIIDDF